MGEGDTIVLDGSFVEDSLYPSLVAALRPDRETLYNTAAGGTAAGAALLAGHEKRKKPATIDMRSPEPIELPDLAAYAARWRASVRTDTATNKDEQT